MRLVNVGLLTPSAESAATLRGQVRATGFGTVSVEVTEYCRSRTDWSVRRFIDVRPDVILVDAEDVPAAITSIQALHTAVPAAWILVCTSVADADRILMLVRAGARELIPAPVTPASLLQALQRYNEERERERQSESNLNGKIYTVCSAKPGSGATTIAINVASSLAELPNAHVAFIDLAWPLGDVATFLNTKPRFTVADALSSAARLDPVLLESYMHRQGGFHVLPGLEDFTAGDALNGTALSQLLEAVTQTYTHAVLDLTVSLPREALEIVVGLSSTIAAVLTPDLLSIRRADRLLKLMAGFNASDRVRLVLNRVRRSDEINERDIEKALRQPVAWKVGNDYQACMEAVNSGKAVLPASSKHLVKDFREMSHQLAGHQTQERRKGLLSLLPEKNTSI